MCKVGEGQPSHDSSAHHRSYEETGSQVRFSHKLVCCMAEWPERIDSTMHLFGFHELLKKLQTFQWTCTLISRHLTRVLLIRSVSPTNSHYALRHFNECVHSVTRPDTCAADTFSFNNPLVQHCQIFQRMCTLTSWDCWCFHCNSNWKTWLSMVAQLEFSLNQF